MRDELTCWEVVLEFTGKQAALAIIGQADTDATETHTNARLVLERMRHDYEETREWFVTPLEEQEKRSPPKVLLVSTAMQDAREGDLVMRDAVADHPYSVWPRTSEQISILFAGELQRKVSVIGFTAWSLSKLSDFDRQTFSRDVLACWLQKVDVTSLYPFTRCEAVAAEQRLAGLRAELAGLLGQLSGTSQEHPDATVGQPQPALKPSSASAEQVESMPIAKRYRRIGWRETAVFDYVVSQYKTIMPAPFKKLLRALESGDESAPLRKVRGGFVMTESGKNLTEKTLETDFMHVRKAASER